MGDARRFLLPPAAVALTLAAQPLSAQTPDAVAAKGEAVLDELHAEGAQVYECKPAQSGALTWQFREPIATLIRDGKTVGRHYAGPSWELLDGSVVVGKAVARAPGAKETDIPWLKLEVSDRRGSGALETVTTIQRVNTKGGQAQGPCPKEGDFLSVPYSADYVFLRKAQ